jgi:hypothetical protein
MVQKFTDQIEELEDELYKARCFEAWLVDVALRAGSWCDEQAWGDEGGEGDVVWEEDEKDMRKDMRKVEEEVVVDAERIVARCRWDN